MTSLLTALARLTTPLLPSDYLSLVNPLWGAQCARVQAVLPETTDAVSLVLRPGPGWHGHRAGQYVRLGVDIDGVRHWRSYSLTSPAGRAPLSVTVTAEPGGLVSTHLVRRTRAGDLVHLQAAQGEFVLPDPTPPAVLFLTAGSGLTPVMGILRSHHLADVVHVHLARDSDAVLFAAELRARVGAAYRLHEWHSRRDGRFPLERLDDLCPDWRERPAWACGPQPLLDEAAQLWGRAGLLDLLQVEQFRPPLASAQGEGGEVSFLRSGRTAPAGPGTSVLDAGEAAGVLLPSGCRMGICHSCVVPLRRGRVRDLRTGSVYGDEGDLVQTCITGAAGPVELDA